MVLPAPERPTGNQTLVKRKEVTAVRKSTVHLHKEITGNGKNVEVLSSKCMQKPKMSWDFSLLSTVKSIWCFQSKWKFDVKENCETVPHRVIS